MKAKKGVRKYQQAKEFNKFAKEALEYTKVALIRDFIRDLTVL
jgi:hypothetical protein